MGIAQKLEEAKKKASPGPQRQIPKTEGAKKAETVIASEPAPESPSIKEVQSEFGDLPSQKEMLRSAFSKKLELHMENLQETIFRATRALNDVTGYLGIEKLKNAVEQLEQELQKQKREVRASKIRYLEAIQKRSDSQKEINELLTRKHNWSPEDVERFTELYRNDHSNQQEEANAEQQLADAEAAVDSVQNKLTQLILTRYHEEQIWSDKIRQALTWGTWIIMGINVLLFTIATFILEPWKRRRLVNAFDAQVQQKMDLFSAEMRSLATGSPVPPATPLETVEKDNYVGQNYTVSFKGLSSWDKVKHWAQSSYAAVKNSQTTFSFAHQDFAVYSAIVLAMGSLFGSALTLLYR